MLRLIKIIIVEDQRILLDSLARAISEENDFLVVDKLTNAAEIHNSVRIQKPDLVLMDVVTESSSGLQESAKLHRVHPDIKILVFTAMPDAAFIEEAEAAGVDSFIYKNVSTSDLLEVMRKTVQGERVFPEKSNKNTLGGLKLTEREIDVLRLVCRGQSRKEIAKTLFLSENTIKTNITSLLAKTGFSSIARLALWAVSTGFIVINESETSY